MMKKLKKKLKKRLILICFRHGDEVCCHGKSGCC